MTAPLYALGPCASCNERMFTPDANLVLPTRKLADGTTIKLCFGCEREVADLEALSAEVSV